MSWKHQVLKMDHRFVILLTYTTAIEDLAQENESRPTSWEFAVSSIGKGGAEEEGPGETVPPGD